MTMSSLSVDTRCVLDGVNNISLINCILSGLLPVIRKKMSTSFTLTVHGTAKPQSGHKKVDKVDVGPTIN